MEATSEKEAGRSAAVETEGVATGSVPYIEQASDGRPQGSGALAETVVQASGEPSDSEASAKATMRAIIQPEYGTTDVLSLAEIERPQIEADEVLVRVHAAGVDRGVWHLMTGLPYLVRLVCGLRRPRTLVPGMDVAGRVEAVGKDVTRFAPGDEVFGECTGSFAEYACVSEKRLEMKPAKLSFEEAAIVPVSACTALQALRDVAKVQAGQKVLVIGASGGVGTYAVQIARAFGAEVTGVCSTRKMDLVRSIGARHVIDYTREDFAESGEQYDLILDIAGNRPLAHLRRALTPEGMLVILGGEEGGRWLGGTDRSIRALMLSPFVSHNFRAPISMAKAEDLRQLNQLIEAGEVSPVLDRSFPLEEAAEAIQFMEAGHPLGKVAIRM